MLSNEETQPMKNVVFYATDTMSDWEYGYVLAGFALAEHEESARFAVRSAAAAGVETVRSIGGLTVVPDTTLDAVGDPDLLILPGASTWGEGHDEVLALVRRVVDAGGLVAAICGATLGLARSGLLDDREHTSNAPDYIAMIPGYHGAEHYREAKTVVDRGVITAPATAPVDFARAVFQALEVFSQEVLTAWYGLYTTGERHYFDELMSA